jgi:hypothetical protein
MLNTSAMTAMLIGCVGVNVVLRNQLMARIFGLARALVADNALSISIKEDLILEYGPEYYMERKKGISLSN